MLDATFARPDAASTTSVWSWSASTSSLIVRWWRAGSPSPTGGAGGAAAKVSRATVSPASRPRVYAFSRAGAYA